MFRHLFTRLRQKIRVARLGFFIQAAGLAYHHRAKRGVYHQIWQTKVCHICISSREACIFPTFGVILFFFKAHRLNIKNQKTSTVKCRKSVCNGLAVSLFYPRFTA